jgi:HlyD family secretion protein
MKSTKTSKQIITILLLMILTVVLGTACSSPNEANNDTGDTTQLFEDFVPVVSATGKLVPDQWASLGLQSAGIVADLKVSENDTVSKGEALLTLSGGVNIQASITGANLELISAQQALQAIYDNENLSAAQSDLTIAVARENLDDAEVRLRNLQYKVDKEDIDQAYANMIVAQDNLNKATDRFEEYEDKPESNVTRAALYSAMIDLQDFYEAKVRTYNYMDGAADEFDIAKANADVAFFEAQVEKAIQDFAKLDNGPDPELLEIANARVANAQGQLAAAEQALTDLTIVAPFDGTVTQIFIQENEWGSPGKPVMVIGDLTNLQIETTDLNEIDVARISIGSIATITFDALPGETIEGTVSKIATKASAGSGVNYSVIIDIEEVPTGLLWDMTAFIDIEISE